MSIAVGVVQEGETKIGVLLQKGFCDINGKLIVTLTQNCDPILCW